MIRPYKTMPVNAFRKACVYGLDDLETKGYVSMIALEYLFNLFYWVYYDKDFSKAIKHKRVAKFFDQFDLKLFKTDSPMQSAVVFYNKLTKVVNMRKFETFKIDVERTSNKKMAKSYFTFKELYKVYKESNSDVPEDILELNEMFEDVSTRKIDTLKNIGEVFNLVNVSDIAKPDFEYKAVSGKLKVFTPDEKEELTQKKLYVIQDSTCSMSNFVDSLMMTKAFILDMALNKGYTVEWLYVTSMEVERHIYDKTNISTFKFPNIRISSEFDVIDILISGEMKGQKVLIITDGTDDFKVPRGLVTKQLNVISFTYNDLIKTKSLNYGKFFKVSV